MTMLFAVTMLSAQGPIPSPDGNYFTSRYQLDSLYDGTVDTIIYHIYYENVVMESGGIGGQFNVYKCAKNATGVWDTIKGTKSRYLPANHQYLGGLHDHLWILDNKDSCDKYFGIDVDYYRWYMNVRFGD